MSKTLEDVPNASPPLSRARLQRPALPQRMHASYNIHLSLPSLKTADLLLPPLDSQSPDSASSSGDEEGDELPLPKVADLAPLCPPSPPSPASPYTESEGETPSEMWASPSESEDDWERMRDGCRSPSASSSASVYGPASPSASTSTSPSSTFFYGDAAAFTSTSASAGRPPWPPTPAFRPEAMYEPRQCAHYGWSNSALADLKGMLWHRRQWSWWSYDEDVRLCATYAPSAAASSDDNEDVQNPDIFLPAPPTLPPSRLTPWKGANGILLPSPGHVQPLPLHAPMANDPYSTGGPPPPPSFARMQRFDPRAAVFPRVGDVAALRDAACERADRTFFLWPSYAIAKHVWMADVARALLPLPQPPSPDCTNANDVPVPVPGRWRTSWAERWAWLLHTYPPPFALQPQSPPQPSCSEWDDGDPCAPPPRPVTPTMMDNAEDDDDEDYNEDEGPYARQSWAAPHPHEFDGEGDELDSAEALAQIVVALPAPVLAQRAVPPRPPTPFDAPVRAPVLASEQELDGDEEGDSEVPVVRLPRGAGVRFSVAPPRVRAGSPRFSFFVGDDGGEDAGAE